mmetsp:Transcript_23015/g.33969  ORF Transcript_23015/g.33969 Transcript_23015/m.33969 type:complete len:281 (+) Transcript_23015:305-1147(+)
MILTTMDKCSEENPKETTKFSALISIFVYLYFYIPFLSFFCFLLPPKVLPFEPPYSCFLDTTEIDELETADAVIWDVALMLPFMITHNILARKKVKTKLASIGFYSKATERTFFVFVAGCTLHLQQILWKPWNGDVIWDFTGLPRLSNKIVGVYVFGFLFLVSATFAIDHFALFGISPAFGALKGEHGMTTRWHYNIVAHPIMTGMLLTLWSTPLMTVSRLMIALIYTVWIALSVLYLEEPELKEMIGDDYSEYLKTVPRFCPFTAPSSESMPVDHVKGT